MRLLPQLTGLRGIAALAVLAFHAFVIYDFAGPHHIAWFWHLTAGFGWLGVDLFFVLSGFLLARGLIHSPSFDLRGWGEFVWRRIVRTAPAYYAAVLVALAMYGSWRYILDRPTDFLAHLVYVPNYDPHLVQSINIVYWSLAVEFQIYLLVPLLVWLLVRHPGTGLFGLLALSMAWPLVLIRQGDEIHNFWIMTQAVPYLFHFGIGIAAARLEALGWRSAMSPARVAAGAFALTLAIAYLLFPPFGPATLVPDRIVFMFARTAPAAGFAMLILVIATHPGRAQRFLASAPLEGLGKVSYSLYLTHLPILHLLDRQLHWTLAAGFEAYLVAALGLSLGAAWILYTFVERPAMAWKSRRLPGTRAPLPPPLVDHARPSPVPG